MQPKTVRTSTANLKEILGEETRDHHPWDLITEEETIPEQEETIDNLPTTRDHVCTHLAIKIQRGEQNATIADVVGTPPETVDKHLTPGLDVLLVDKWAIIRPIAGKRTICKEKGLAERKENVQIVDERDMKRADAMQMGERDKVLDQGVISVMNTAIMPVPAQIVREVDKEILWEMESTQYKRLAKMEQSPKL